MRRLGVVSFIAPASLSISSLLWVMFASMEGDIYTGVSAFSLYLCKYVLTKGTKGLQEPPEPSEKIIKLGP